ncbi:MAG TPA: PEP-CTERM sorting domain-containing protein [Pirellulales bacterium]|jgi:hypothetical protein|nr:PEP-CTERM sorting domain-containing protein [Pirellulales bacterium]
MRFEKLECTTGPAMPVGVPAFRTLLAGALFVGAFLSGSLFASLPTLSHAANITDNQVTVAPGSANVVTSAYFPGGYNYAEPNVTFYDTTPVQFDITVDDAGTYDISEAPLFGAVYNQTGATWTGYTFSLTGGPVGANFEFVTGLFAPYDYTNIFGAAISGPNNNTVNFTGTLSTGNYLEPNVTFQVDMPGTYTLVQTPIIAAPEPSSWLLLCLGTLGAAAFVRRSREKARAVELCVRRGV